MQNNQGKATNKLRQEIAQIAARYVAVDGVNDFFTAKRKAAMHMGVDPDRNMPTNQEVEQALVNYQSMFLAKQQSENVKLMRTGALKAMRFLSDYKPKLVGPVLKGTASIHSEIILHLYTDQVDEVGFRLTENGIPYEACEKSVRVNSMDTLTLPAYKFIADKFSLLLVVFSEKQKNISPVSSSTGKSMTRASINNLQSILDQTS
jgi:hypothetical protein